MKQLGAKEKARRKTCDLVLSVARRNRVFQKNIMRIDVRKLLMKGLVPARVWRGLPVGIAPHRMADIEEADGSSTRRERVDVVISSWR